MKFFQSAPLQTIDLSRLFQVSLNSELVELRSAYALA